MKKITFLIAFIAVAIFANAQSNTEEVDFYQSIFGMGKKAVVADFLNIQESDQFWTLYDAYEAERKELGKDRIQTLAYYAQNYDNMNDAKADEIIKSMISLRNANDKLMDKYYKKIKKTSGTKVAAQFFQLEAYFLSEIRSSIMEQIPFIGAFDN